MVLVTKVAKGDRNFVRWSSSEMKLGKLDLLIWVVCLNVLTCNLDRNQGNAASVKNTSLPFAGNSEPDDPDEVVEMVHKSLHDSRRKLGIVACSTGNPIDDCWRCDPNWAMNRQKLADCAIGFGRDALGGKNGSYYVVTDSSDDDPVNPKPGTLRHAVIQVEPLWIIFQSDMGIRLKQELFMNSFKTIDGRGVNVHIAHGGCITIKYVSNIIIHGVSIHDCIPTGDAVVSDSPTHHSYRSISDGDGVSIFGSRYIWIDHCFLSNCHDGLIDATMGSTAITISNNFFSNHDKVMLMGHSDDFDLDVIMQVTITFNHFGEGLVQRMPRCRHGYFHVVNNDYRYWEMYAIGGSANPTINSEGNRYIAPDDPNAKEVTKRLEADEEEWVSWNWRSEGDLMVNGAHFTSSGAEADENYVLASSLGPQPVFFVDSITAEAGALGVPRPEEDAHLGGRIAVSDSISRYSSVLDWGWIFRLLAHVIIARLLGLHI